MRSSSLARIVLAFAMAGCAGAAAPPPSPAPAPGATSTAAPHGGASVAGGARAADPRLDPRLNPSEEITAEELASIPEPIPGVSSAATPAPRTPAPAAASTSPPAPTSTSSPTAAPSAAAPTTPTAPGVAWRVQIFASPDLAAADSVAKAASTLLASSYAIEFEGDLYKVRLGAFGSEQEAQGLRDRAVRSGFPGAFRVKSVTR